MQFRRGDKVKHRNGGEYMVILTPVDGVKIAATGEPAYLYQNFWLHDDPTFWVRSQEKMEERFELVAHTTAGAGGRLPRGLW